ncbi:SA1362 family protein [Radiobacillus deserti]|uniref:Uncharacterized protein n=1 Tax=Radiobacillus deserti TaxID=2594883 RepID=A0A516KGS4_9BACI|nr:SA1362 family protein [Radiobacillus deserti]QDP40579.1 hypothetical protein FN924_10490 [Radiobacillus deserti]
MSRNKFTLFIYVIIGLAVFGFASQLVNNTASLVRGLLTTVVVGAILYGIVYVFFLRNRTSNELKKYKKAVRQSKAKYTNDGKNTYAQAAKKSSNRLIRRKNVKPKATHLRVIEGNKQKRKNRASF